MTEIEEIETRFVKQIEKMLSELPNKYNDRKLAKSNCASSTIKNYLEIIDRANLNLVNMASPLASITGVCGAVNAGLMIVGMIIGKFGQKEVDFQKASNEGMKFLKQFNKEFNSIQCSVLTGYDLLTTEGMVNYVRNNIWKKQCYKHVVKSIEKIGSLYKKQIARLVTP